MKKTVARILGTGSYLPEKVLTNADLEKIVDTTDEWIVSRTGMKERRVAKEKECPSDMGAHAAKIALERSGLKASQLDLIIVATVTSDYPMPSAAALVQTKIQAPQAAVFDLNAACTGFLYALSTAKAFIESEMYQHVLVIGAEKLTPFINYEDRSTCILFGDGAAAAVISNKGSGLAIHQTSLGGDGSLARLIMIPAGGSCNPPSAQTIEAREHFFLMEGREVFKHAVRRMKEAAVCCLDRAGLTSDDLSWLVPHQANLRILDAVGKALTFPPEKICCTVHKYGNTSAASVPVTLDELLQKETIKTGAHLLLVAFGAGLTWGAVLLTQIKGEQ